MESQDFYSAIGILGTAGGFILVVLFRRVFRGSFLSGYSQLAIIATVIVGLVACCVGYSQSIVVAAYATPPMLLVVSLQFIYLRKKILIPLLQLKSILEKLSLGDIDVELKVKDINRKDEIGRIQRSLATYLSSLKARVEFAVDVKNGVLDSSYQLTSTNDVLGSTLLEMRDKLIKVTDEANDVARLVYEEGSLNVQMETTDKDGAWKELSISLNKLIKSISQPVQEIASILMELANGNLTNSYSKKEKGEIGELTNSLNASLTSLSQLLQSIYQNTGVLDEASNEMLNSGQEMNASTDEIASAIDEMSKGAGNQVNKVDESSHLIESILETSKEMSNKSKSINEAAKSGVSNSEKGYQIIKSITEKINNISDHSNTSRSSMDKLLKNSERIEQVLVVLTGISNQTNLLALNAAIEAAQAGEAGRGFAVVAEEIRKLAEDSKKSAYQIEKLIHSMRDDTNTTSEQIRHVHSIVEEGVTTSREASNIFNEISISSKQTLEHSDDVLALSSKQAEKVGNIVSITESIVVIAEETSTGSNEVAASATQLANGMSDYIQKAKELKNMSLELRKGIEKFKLKKESQTEVEEMLSVANHKLKITS